MNILEELKLSKKQNNNKRYDYLSQQFNVINYAIKLEKYTIKLQQENQKQKEVIDRLNFIKNRKNQGASQENINKMAIEFVNSWLKEVSE